MKVTGIKKAVGTFNDHVGHARIMLDKNTGEVWCDIFASCNEFKVYEDKDIIPICVKGLFHMDSNWDRTSMKRIEKAVEYRLSGGEDFMDYLII